MHSLPVRRPLCLAALLFAAILYLFLALAPPEYPDFSGLKGSQVTLCGRILEKELRKNSEGTEQLLLTLSDCHPVRLVPGSADSEALYTQTDLFDSITAGSAHSGLRALITLPAESADTLPIGCSGVFAGTLYPFEPAMNPGQFDAETYYHTLKLSFRLVRAKALKCSEKSRDPLGDLLDRLRRYFSSLLDECLSEEDASVLKAVLLGEKGFLSEETRSLYQESGILHILAISGLHISILGMGLLRLLKKLSLPDPVCFLFSGSFILLYARMVGGSPSSFRAVSMFFLMLLADTLHRTYDLLSALSLSAVLLLMDQPLYLYHTGFLFSFGCVTGLGLFLPALEEFPSVFKAAAVPIFTLPIQLMTSYSFPIYAWLLNLAVIPLMSSVLVSSLLLLAAALFSVRAGRMIGILCHLILYFYDSLCHLVRLLPFYSLTPGQPSLWQVLLFGLLIGCIIVFSDKLRARTKLLLTVPAVCALLITPKSALTIDFPYVGQGDCNVITCGRTHLLIDGGSTSEQQLSEYILTPFLKSRGITKLDAVIITHTDQDHCSGVLSLLQEDNITIGRLFLPRIPEELINDNYRQLLLSAQKKDIPVLFLSQGDVLTFGQKALGADALTLCCLNPAPEAVYSELNETSVVLYLKYRGFTALFTGDAEGNGETQLLEFLREHPEYPTDIDLLKVAHHGSSGATGQDFLDAVQIRSALISCGIGNSYGHPHEALLDRLLEEGLSEEAGNLFITAHSGRVRFCLKERFGRCFLRIQTFRQ